MEQLNIKKIHENPFIGTIDNFLTSSECEHFIDLSNGKLKRALVSSQKKGEISSGRTGSNYWIPHNKDEITQKVSKRIAEYVKIPLENAESFQLIQYDEKQEYRNHYDGWLHDNSEKTLRNIKYGGQRMLTVLVYLNDVEEGGGTRFSKLNISIEAKKGRMLIFQNVYKNTNIRHELSEHCGMPVVKGYKYAFNLWFRECSGQYSKFNPDYYNKHNEIINEPTCKGMYNKIINEPITELAYNVKDDHSKLHVSKEMYKVNSYINTKLSAYILDKCKFDNSNFRSCWVKLSEFPDLTKRLEETIGIDKSFFENINVVEYTENKIHNKHFNAYDLNSDSGKKYTSKLGQRLFTITLILSDNIEMNFSNIKSIINFNKGDLLLYKNVINNSVKRDSDMQRSIVCKKDNGYLANIYIRCNNKNGGKLIEVDSKSENYIETLNYVLEKFHNNKVKRQWNGFKSFKYNFKGDFNKFKKYVNCFNTIRCSLEGKTCLNKTNMDNDYNLDAKLPIQIINNVLDSNILALLQKYYKETIKNQVWSLGDSQSKRYKSHNEPMSRFLHYECLPLIEKIVGRSLKPTYTYLSAYVKGADLPPHTDRPECEYTVSFIVDKPKNCKWNIYVHKIQQEEKYKGRYDEKPPIDECVSVDCDAGGLMLFQGTDHIHFREKFEDEYYNILLLHYCSI
jgi:hypothetical protein